MLLAGILLAACGKKNAAAGPPPAVTPEVSVFTVRTESVKLTTELSGRVTASLTAEVRPQVGGIIQKRLFVEGSDVKEGDTLYQIDPASYQAAYDGAKATLAKAEANLSAIQLKTERYEKLRKDDAVSSQDYEDAAAALSLTQADIAAAKAALETARIHLEYTRITAPISGRIGRSAFTNGALVAVGQATPLATIQALDPVYVDIAQSSAEMLALRKALESGQIDSAAGERKVSLILDDNSAYSETGALKFTEAFVDQSTGSVTLRSLFSNPKMTLLPGMFVRAFVDEGMKENAILVPQRGVTRSPAGSAMVMLVGAGEKVEPRMITTERTVGNNWLVSSGLKPGDRVIMEGIQKARPGTVVKASPFGEAAPAVPGKH